ncbi:MAG: FAD binding domain-containing protein [Acidobacteriota bacterium]|nr:FAD binding domain-containing protein [Acidobacteriota bacterium]MDQ5870751.1 FAD binding domain-containing protein [Acidobacteriota bacterium]
MRLPKFRYYSPRTVAEAVAIRSDAGPESTYVAGGTDLYPNMKRRQQTPKVVIGLSRVRELAKTSERGGELALGAGLLLSDVENDARVRAAYPGLAHAVSEISTPLLRNMGTLGGNLLLDTRCNYYDQNYEWRQAIDFCMKKDGTICWVAPGSPKCLAVQSADTVPVLIAMGARALLVSREGEREVAVEDLYRNDGIDYVTKRPDELLTEVILPKPNGWRASYRKLRRRGAFDFPVLSVGAAVWREAETVTAARLVLGGVASAPLRLSAAEAALVGRPLDDESIAAASSAAAGPSRPMDNTDFSFLWRKDVTREYVARALRDLRTGRTGLPG